MLKKILDGNIQILDEVKNWEESIEIASKPLLEKNIITQNYINAMIESIKKLGFFVVLTDYIAMPHARPEEGAVETAVSFLKLNNPVKYGENDIYLIFVLSAKDSTSHIEIITELMELFQDDEKIEKLIKAKNIDEIEKIVN